MSSLPVNVSARAVGRILRAALAMGYGGLEGAAPREPANQSDVPVPGQPSPPDFEGDALSLFRLLERRGIRYLLVGGIALLRYVKGRNTDHLDLIVAQADLDRLVELTMIDRNADFAHAKFGSLRLDLLLTQNPVFAEALETQSTLHRFAELSVPCATPTGLVLLNLYALPSLYRQRDLARAALYENDILMLMQHEAIDTRPLIESLRPHLDAGSLRELGAILSEIKARLDRMRRT